MEFDQKKFNELMGSDLKDAEAYLRKFLEEGGSDSDLTESLLRLETEMLKIQNEIDGEYLKELEEVRDELKEIKGMKKENDDQIKLEETRADLNI